MRKQSLGQFLNPIYSLNFNVLNCIFGIIKLELILRSEINKRKRLKESAVELRKSKVNESSR